MLKHLVYKSFDSFVHIFLDGFMNTKHISEEHEEIYIDKNGYERYKNSDMLVHRKIAYDFIFVKNRDKYFLGYAEYVVHHKNENKRNNNIDNLEILTQEEHKKLHEINKNKNLEYLFYKK